MPSSFLPAMLQSTTTKPGVTNAHDNGCQTPKTRTKWRVQCVASLFLVIARGVPDLEHLMSFKPRVATICIFEIEYMYSASLFSKTWASVYLGRGLSESSPVITRGAQHLEHLHFFQQRLAVACIFDLWISVLMLTFFRRFLLYFSKVFAPPQWADLFSLSNPSSSTYSLLCEITYMHTVAHHHLQPLWEVHSTLSTCISFQPRSVTVCLFAIQTPASYPAVVLGFTKKTRYIRDIYFTCKI